VQDVKQSEQPQALRPAPQAERKSGQSSGVRHWLSRLRAYLILDPLILSYTFVLGVFALIVSFFDSTGRRQHAIASV
jgi:hypothetical protein